MPTIVKVGKVGASKPMKVRESCSRVVGVGCAGNREAGAMIRGSFLGACDDRSVVVSLAKDPARIHGLCGAWISRWLPSSDVSPAG